MTDCESTRRTILGYTNKYRKLNNAENVKLKKIQKSEKISDWSDVTHPPAYPIFFFKQLEAWKQHKKTQKNTTFPKSKLKSELGLDPPTHFRVFLGFFDFF